MVALVCDFCGAFWRFVYVQMVAHYLNGSVIVLSGIKIIGRKFQWSRSAVIRVIIPEFLCAYRKFFQTIIVKNPLFPFLIYVRIQPCRKYSSPEPRFSGTNGVVPVSVFLSSMTKKQCSFKPLLSPYSVGRPVDLGREFQRQALRELEIGFGMGEVLIRNARRFPERDFIGLEFHWERFYKTLRGIELEDTAGGARLTNIRIIKLDARIVFERLLDIRTLDKVYCLFPCPWPKKGHVKHRLFSGPFLKLVNSRLKNDGELTVLTDYYPYCTWILEQADSTGFHVEVQTVSSQHETKFEKKWRGEGQEEFFQIRFRKQRHIRVPLKKDTRLKNYSLKEFDRSALRLEDEKGDISVIFKDVLFDETQQRGMVRALVAEEHLTQHVWIAITHKDDRWRIACAEGQNFFPTEGVARALELVYAAARKTSIN